MFCGKYLFEQTFVNKHLTNRKVQKELSVQLSESLSGITISQGSLVIFYLNIWLFFFFFFFPSYSSAIFPSPLWLFFISAYRFTSLLGWCKSNCGFALLNFSVRYWSTFLNKFGYAIHYFNVHFLLYIFSYDLLLAVYFIFILDYRNDVREKSKFEQFFFIQVQNGS